MPLTEEFEKQLSAAVEAAIETEDTKEDDHVEETDSAVAESETGDRDAEDRQDDSEGVQDVDAAGETDEEDQGEGNEAGEDGGEAEGKAEPSLSDSALTAAVRAGLDLEVARTFKDDASLLKVVESITRVVKPKAEEQKVEEKDPFADLPDLDPEEYDEKIIKAFDGMKGVLKQQHEQLQAFRREQEDTKRSAETAAARDIEQWFDSQVAALGDDFKDVLGQGSMAALPQASAQYVKRSAIADEMAIRIAGLRASGKPIPSREELFQQATKTVLADEFVARKEKSLKDGLARRAKQHSHRPDRSNGKKQETPEEEVARILSEKFDFSG